MSGQLGKALHYRGNFKLVSTALLGKTGLLEAIPNHITAGPDASEAVQAISSWNNTGNREEKPWGMIQACVTLVPDFRANEVLH